jgi:hypothetical protein
VKRCRLALASAAVWATVAATPAGAVDKVVEVASNGPGPKAYDRVFVHEMGPRDADSVLVLMPGTQGGAGDLTLIAEELIKRVDDLQVWAIDRRSQALEDTAMFERTLAGEATPQECSTTTSAGPSTAAARRITSTSSMPRQCRSHASGGCARRSTMPAGSFAPPDVAGAGCSSEAIRWAPR